MRETKGIQMTIAVIVIAIVIYSLLKEAARNQSGRTIEVVDKTKIN